jgi:hypothetical protein
MPTIDYTDPNFTAPEPSTLCEPAEIPHSNRTGVNKCMDRLSSYPAEGTECFYECEPGYIPLGRHVCQWHDLDWIANNSLNTDPKHDERGWLSQRGVRYKFFGGRCQKLCGNHADQTCSGHASGVTRRYAKSAMTSKIGDRHAMYPHAMHGYSHGETGAPNETAPVDCMATACFPTAKDNLWNVAKGVYDVMQIARDKASGVYYNEVNIGWFVRYMENEHAAKYKIGNGSPVDLCEGEGWLHEALGVYQDEMFKSGGIGLNRGGGGKNYSIDATAMGIMTEVVGSALAFQSPSEAVQKIVDTINNLTHGAAHEVVHNHTENTKTEGKFNFYRDSRGFFQHFYVHRNMDRTNPVVTAMLVQAALFARSYFSAVAAGERAKIGGSESWGGRTLEELDVAEKASFAGAVSGLSTVVEELYDSIDFTHIGCDDETDRLTPGGTGIPFTILKAESDYADMCGGGATAYPDKNGLYNFTEAHNYVYLAYQQACGAQPPGECNNTDIELLWNRWQARKANPNHHYSDVPLLTSFGGYMLQMLYYTNNNFNNDTRYQELFYNNWWADEMFFKQGLYAGKRGRYGLAEGPEGGWCNERKVYHSMSLHEKIHAVTPGVRTGMIIGATSHCEAFSGNTVAGYLPANQEEIYKHLLLLLEDGEAVLPIPCTDHAVLWRESLMDPKRGITAGDGREGRITTLDLSPSLMGLATVFLPDKSFYKKYSRHFAHDGEVAGPTSMAELRARRLKLEASKTQLAEGEEILVKCNGLCDRDGPVLSELYDASGTPEQP